MIRDFTKSAMSFSWALSLLGMKQAINLFRPGQQRGGDLFAPMTQVAVDQLDDSTRGIFRSGDNLQARTVDMAFSLMNPMNWLNPNTWMRPFTNCGQQGSNRGQGASMYGQGGTQNGGYGQAGNGFAQAAAGIGQAFNQAAAGFTQAVGQTTAGLAQAVTGAARPMQNAAAGPSVNTPGAVPVSNESAAAGWGPMPNDE